MCVRAIHKYLCIHMCVSVYALQIFKKGITEHGARNRYRIHMLQQQTCMNALHTLLQPFRPPPTTTTQASTPTQTSHTHAHTTHTHKSKSTASTSGAVQRPSASDIRACISRVTALNIPLWKSGELLYYAYECVFELALSDVKRVLNGAAVLENASAATSSSSRGDKHRRQGRAKKGKDAGAAVLSTIEQLRIPKETDVEKPLQALQEHFRLHSYVEEMKVVQVCVSQWKSLALLKRRLLDIVRASATRGKEDDSDDEEEQDSYY